MKVVSVPKAAPAHSPAPAGAFDPHRTAPEQQSEMTIDEEMDLDEIAELARKIEERTR